MVMKKAILHTFYGEVKRLFGRNFIYIGFKGKAMIGNIQEIRRLIWIHLNSDCISFFIILTELRS